MLSASDNRRSTASLIDTSPHVVSFVIMVRTLQISPMVCHNICLRIYSKIEVGQIPVLVGKNIAEDVSVAYQ
jgi:hypothetical protein